MFGTVPDRSQRVILGNLQPDADGERLVAFEPAHFGGGEVHIRFIVVSKRPADGARSEFGFAEIGGTRLVCQVCECACLRILMYGLVEIESGTQFLRQRGSHFLFSGGCQP